VEKKSSEKSKEKSISGNRSVSFLKVFDRLSGDHGPQHWWPGDSPFEIMVGAVLTQNTAWTNVEKAIHNLKAAKALKAAVIVSASHEKLARWLTPSGYFNIKARRLKNLCVWYLSHGGYDRLKTWRTDKLRAGLLSVNGVGFETADDILLYAFERPVFVIDAYTRRIFSRLGMVDHDMTYESLRHHFEQALAAESQNKKNHVTKRQLINLYNEYHALIVMHGKDICRKRPRCQQCCLKTKCPSRQH